MASNRRRNPAMGRESAGPWLASGALVLALACLLGMVVQGLQLAELQKEMEQLRQETMRTMPGTFQDDNRIFTNVQRMEELITPLVTLDDTARPGHSTSSMDLSREKRDTSKKKKPPPKKKRSVVHLIPVSRSSSDEKDLTEIEWKAALSQGNALEVKGKTTTVKEDGLYLVYSQVLYRDITFVMGHTVSRSPKGDEAKVEVLFRCVQSMPENEEISYNSCYSGGVFKLQKDDIIKLLIPRANAFINMSGDTTFLGLVKL